MAKEITCIDPNCNLVINTDPQVIIIAAYDRGSDKNQVNKDNADQQSKKEIKYITCKNGHTYPYEVETNE